MSLLLLLRNHGDVVVVPTGASFSYQARITLPVGFYAPRPLTYGETGLTYGQVAVGYGQAGPSRTSQLDLLRWDNFVLYPGTQDVGGLVIWGSGETNIRLVRGTINGPPQQEDLIVGPTLAEGVEYLLRVVHASGNQTEFFIDGVSVGTSTAPWNYGREITAVRAGVVSSADPLTVLVDDFGYEYAFVASTVGQAAESETARSITRAGNPVPLVVQVRQTTMTNTARPLTVHMAAVRIVPVGKAFEGSHARRMTESTTWRYVGPQRRVLV